MKRRKILAAALICAVLCALCACGASDTAQAAAPALPELKIGVDTLKPFFYTDENGDYVGIDAEIAEEACRRAGYTPKFIEVAWSGRDRYLQNGTVDCIWSAFIKNGREDLYCWTDSYLQSSLRVLVSSRSPDAQHDLKSIRSGIAVRAGSKIEELFLNDTNGSEPVNIYSCGTFQMAETAFIKGYVGSLGGHEAVLRDVIARYPGMYCFLDGTLMDADLGVAFRKDNPPDAYQKINDAIREMKADGTITAIADKYTSEQTTDKEGSANAQQ